MVTSTSSGRLPGAVMMTKNKHSGHDLFVGEELRDSMMQLVLTSGSDLQHKWEHVSHSAK